MNKEKHLSNYTDEEIAKEYYWRMQKKLGDPRISVSSPMNIPDYPSYPNLEKL